MARIGMAGSGRIVECRKRARGDLKRHLDFKELVHSKSS